MFCVYHDDTTECMAVVKPWDETLPELRVQQRKITWWVYLLSMLFAFLLVFSSMWLLELHLAQPATMSFSVSRSVRKPVLLVSGRVKKDAGKKTVSVRTAGMGARKVVPVPASSFVFPNYFHHPGQSYGQVFAGAKEQGQDYDAPFRSPALSLWPGKVFLAERTCWNTSCTSTSGGVVIVISIVPGYGRQSMYYLHLDSIDVFAGDVIKKGQILGLTGGQTSGGNWPTSPQFSSGPHIEIGSCASFLPCPVGYNFDPRASIQQAIQT